MSDNVDGRVHIEIHTVPHLPEALIVEPEGGETFVALLVAHAARDRPSGVSARPRGPPDSEVVQPWDRDVLHSHPKYASQAGNVAEAVDGQVSGPGFSSDPHPAGEILAQGFFKEGQERKLQTEDYHHLGRASVDPGHRAPDPLLDGAAPSRGNPSLNRKGLLEGDAGSGGLEPQQLEVLVAVLVIASQDDEPVPPEVTQQPQHDRNLLLGTRDGAESDGEYAGVAESFRGCTVGDLERRRGSLIPG